MLDIDGDFRADALRLTYSQAIRHTADRDGVYPFSVVGYRVRSVGAARGRVLVLGLFEKSAPDPRARPAVRYRPTRSAPVTDTSGRQALAQAFRATRAHGHVPAAPVSQTTTVVVTTTTSTANASLDRDRDGTPDARDCAPLDASIHPGAPDPPDLSFVDSNCDGVDGTEADAVFVSPNGNAANPGTTTKPMRQIQAAIDAVKAGAGSYVLAAAGSYAHVQLAPHVSVYGGYEPTDWSHRSRTPMTVIAGVPEGVLGATGVVLQNLSVQGATDKFHVSAYGIRAIPGAAITLQGVTVTAGSGTTVTGQASNGANGANGAFGGRGHDGEPGSCDDDAFAGGGTGGTGAASYNGGVGGNGGWPVNTKRSTLPAPATTASAERRAAPPGTTATRARPARTARTGRTVDPEREAGAGPASARPLSSRRGRRRR
jgi:hypothetical protein